MQNSQTGIFDWLKNKTIAFVGDSVTADTKSNFVTLTLDSLANKIDVTSLKIINSGVDSSSILDAIDRLPEIFLSYNPDVFVVLLGINDSKIFRSINRPLISPSMFEENYSFFLDMVDYNRIRPKILVTPPPLLFSEIEKGEYLKDYWYWTLPGYLNYINAIRRMVKRPKCIIADVYNSFEIEGNHRRLFYEDGVHPNIYGHRLIAEGILDSLSFLGNHE